MKKIKEKRRKKKRIEDKIWNLTKKLLGMIFIVVGIIGLFLPFLQGILLILIGLALFHNKSIKKYISSLFEK